MKPTQRKKYLLAIILFLAGCTSLQLQLLNEEYGEESPNNRVSVAQFGSPNSSIDYLTQVKPILETRCVVCHGCYDAPCQLKLEAPIGIERGASKLKIYTPRLEAAEAEPLFEVGFSPADWRSKGFYPVLNERIQTPQANRESSLMYQMLLLKQQVPGTSEALLDDSFDLSLGREQSCPRIDQFHDYAETNPSWGMPFGLPALSSEENQILMSWLEDGARLPDDLVPEPNANITIWEEFLNGNTLKEQLSARYIYEHLYLANIYFPEQSRKFYRLVRSKTPPGEEIERIVTRRPYEDPEVSRVYYRLEAYPGSITAKNHMPYRLDEERMSRYRELFLDAEYRVDELPGYEPLIASNPFKSFQAIPVKSRYKFMLDEARFTIMGFIKGPVCRGQLALDVIDDHFWVFFEDPDDPTNDAFDQFLREQSDQLRLPASDSSTVLSPLNWRNYSRRQNEYLAAKQAFLRELEQDQSRSLNRELIWDGGDSNPNAALTVFRHFDSASVEFGFIGDEPKTSWLITYPLLERIHYLLVAGFDVYGNIGHQLQTRLYMDFLRMEGEANFLELLPLEDRMPIQEHWYRDVPDLISDYIFSDNLQSTAQTQIQFSSDDPKQELFGLLADHIEQSSQHPFRYDESSTSISRQLDRLAVFSGEKVAILPHQSFLTVTTGNSGSSETFSIIKNAAHLNVAHPFDEQDRLIPAENTVTIAKGIIGTYPNTFFAVDENQLSGFVDDVLALENEDDYFKLVTAYGVRRTSPNFWAHSDGLHREYFDTNPIEAGLLDFNRLENR